MKTYLLLIFLLIPTINLYAQSTISGKIVDENNLPLAHVSIQQMGVTVLSRSDESGQFSVKLNGIDNRLLFTIVGYSARIVPADSLLNVNRIILKMMPEMNQLAEVTVSTGYQRLPKERATGSFDYISKETLSQQVSTDVLSRLEAVANGLTFNRSSTGNTGPASIQIRGLSTIMGVEGPLIILDNFPYEGDINNINPNDVEDITILKDAAATSIWGTKAGNGVIVITTKKGKRNRPIGVNFNTNITVADKPNLRYLDQLSSPDFIDVERFLFQQGYKFSDTANVNRPPFSEAYELLFRQRRGELSTPQTNALLNELGNYNYIDQLQKYVYEKPLRQQYALEMNGGSDNMGWLMSAGMDRNSNELGAEYRRLNLRFNSEFRPLKNLTVNTSLMVTQATDRGGRDGYNDIRTANGALPPYTRLADENGEALPIIRDYRLNSISNVTDGNLLDWNYYPLDEHLHRDRNTKLNDLLLNASAHYELFKGLSVNTNYQYENQQSNGSTLFDADSYTVRNLVNRFTQFDPLTNKKSYIVPHKGIQDISNARMVSHQVRGQVNFDKQIAEDHHLNVLAGGEVRETVRDSYGFRTYGFDKDNLTISNVDLTRAYPTILPIGRTAFIPNNNSFDKSVNRFVSTYANMAYTFKDRYVLTLSGRRDASNLFGVNTNNKWTPLWSAGAGYEISKESFYRSVVLPYLRVRFTYGFSGNADPSRSAVTTISYLGTNLFTQTPYAVVSQYANPALRWERIGMWNSAIDFGFYNNRIKGSLEYYRKNGTDLFGVTRIDYTSGINSGLVKNVASMNAEGIDVNLNSLNLNGNLKWMTTFNFSYNWEKVTDYYLGSERGSNYVQGSSAITSLVGKPVHSIFSYQWYGLDPSTGNPLGWLNGETSQNYRAITGDSTTINDLIYHGSAQPTVFGSLGNDLSFKGFSLSVRFIFKLGYYFRKTALNYTELFANRRGHQEYTDRWQQPGDEISTNVPSLVYPAVSARDAFYGGSEINVLKGDHVRLQYVNLAYSLPERSITPLHLKQLQLYINLSNLGVVWRANKYGIDPDYNTMGAMPPAKTYAFGLRATF